jgi:two-component system NtrC family sensor kinase
MRETPGTFGNDGGEDPGAPGTARDVDPVPAAFRDDRLREELEQERVRLVHRPTLRIRTRITLSFLFVFAFCVVVTLWSMYTLSRIQEKNHFLEVADSYVSEIQQARRFEKNFLLYGTNLEDAQEHLERAVRLLDDNQAVVRKILGVQKVDTLSRHVANYERLLQRLGETSGPEARESIEAELRLHGSEMIAFAMDFAREERAAVERAFLWARRVPFAFLGVLLLTILTISVFLTRQFLGTLSRFMEYTRRIGEGDFSPIKPVRKYSDEFSQLALAFNQMICELDRRQRILVESHKVRAIGTLVAGVAHELNNPLNNIMLTASVLQEDHRELDDAAIDEMIGDVLGETERSRRIVRNLLDFARESEIRVTPLHLDEIVGNAVRLVGNQIKMAKIRLETEIDPDLPTIHGDSQVLCQVFVNLILNAVDVLPEGGRIRVRAHRSEEEGFIAVDVEDDGPGIPEHLLDRIFEPFFTTKTKGRGTGLGLSVSRGIVGKLGGTIRVRSRVGEGAVFTVLLPTTNVPFAGGEDGGAGGDQGEDDPAGRPR